MLCEVSQADLKNQIEYLRVENIILRRHCLHKRPVLTDEDRNKLLKYGLPLGPKIKHVISIVHYSTFRQWVQHMSAPKNPQSKHGRPRIITGQTRQLIVTMARQNKWGCLKILAELRKLCIQHIGKTSVSNILKEYGVEPFTVRCEDTRDQFLKRTFHTLWACDFFSKYVWTPFGRRLYHVLFFINIKTRQVHLAGITKRVDDQWLIEHLHKIETAFGHPLEKCALVRDRDIRFSKEFDRFFEQKNIKIMKIPRHSPNLNPYAESWVATIKRECLNYFLVVGPMHLEYLVKEFLNYYNLYRPHSGMDNAPLSPYEQKEQGDIKAKPLLGGLMHHYYRG
jgi:putative transposase